MTKGQAEILLKQLVGLLDEERWIAPMSETLEGVTAAQAAWKASPGSNTIWQILNHLSFWKRHHLNKLEGIAYTGSPIHNGETFGDPGDPEDDPGWQAAVRREQETTERLRSYIMAHGDTGMEQGLNDGSVGELLADMIVHDAYHLGQIMLLRKLQGSWPATRE